MKSLEGKIALISGGSRGIGRALCVQLSALGAHVYTFARDSDALARTRQLCAEGASFTGVQADVTDPEAVEQVVARIAQAHGRLDILVNNAAVLGPRKKLEDVSLTDWQRTQQVNVDGVFIVTTQSLGLLRQGAPAIILNVSSSVGRTGRAGWGPYGVSKHAVEGISETLAEELLGDEICVVSINPGGTATEMRQQAYPDEDPATLPTADDIAATFVLLIRSLSLAQTGRKYDARSLLDLIKKTDPSNQARRPELGGADLPFVR